MAQQIELAPAGARSQMRDGKGAGEAPQSKEQLFSQTRRDDAGGGFAVYARGACCTQLLCQFGGLPVYGRRLSSTGILFLFQPKSPDVSNRSTSLDNQTVKKGDPVVELDSAGFRCRNASEGWLLCKVRKRRLAAPRLHFKWR